MNRVLLTGRLTRDPEMRTLSSGKMVTTFNLATNEYRSKGQEKSEFHSVVTWDRLAEIAGQYVTKGTPLLVEGRLKLDTWEKDGKKNSKLRVVGERFVLLGGREGGGAARGPADGGAPKARRPAPEDPGSGDSFPEHARGPSGPSGGGDGGYPGGSDDDIPF